MIAEWQCDRSRSLPDNHWGSVPIGRSSDPDREVLKAAEAIADVGSVRQRVLGVIGLVWGGAILVVAFAGHTTSHTSGAYHGGQIAGVVFGAIFLLAGARALIKSLQ